MYSLNSSAKRHSAYLLIYYITLLFLVFLTLFLLSIPIIIVDWRLAMSKSAALYCRLSKDDLSFGESSSISTQNMQLAC